MSESQDDGSAWARPGSARAPATTSPVAAATSLPPAPGVAPAPATPAKPKKRGDWQTIAALIIFPIPVALWIGVIALFVGVIEFPQMFSKGCTTDCLALQDDVRAAYANPRACDGSGPRLCFVPMGSFSRADVERLTTYYRERYGINAAVLPGIDLDPSVLDAVTGQAFAPLMLQLIRDEYPALNKDAGVTLIGLTTVDMYEDEEAAGWFDFTMAIYRPDQRVGVVSSAEMHPKFLWFKLEETQGSLRLQKQVNLLVGLMHFGYPPSADPRSALYYGTISPWSLDQMPADLPVAKPR